MATYEYLDQAGLQMTLNKLKTVLETIYAKKTDLLSISVNADLTTGVKIGTITINDVPVNFYIPALDTEMSDTSEAGVQNKVIKKYVDDAVGAVVSIKFEKVTVLPTTGQNGVIYLVPKTVGAETDNVYEEYIWIEADSTFEKIGETKVDLTNYVQKDDIKAMESTDIDAKFKVVFPEVFDITTPTV